MLRVIRLPHEEDDAPIASALHEGLPLLDDVKDYIESNTKDVLAKLPPPLPHRRNKHIYLLASIILIFSIFRTLTAVPYQQGHFEVAKRESFGFFRDVPVQVWNAKKHRVQNQPKHNDKELGLRSKYANRNSPSKWYNHNWQPNFDCQGLLRIGGHADSSKYVCDVHRIEPSKDCLIYSFGRGSPTSRTFDFAFERELLAELDGKCEVHFFDHRFVDEVDSKQLPKGVIAHNWSLEGEIDAPKARRGFMTLKETVHHLGHEGRNIEIMRVDCDGCEWHTYQEWLTSGVTPRQVVVSLHGAPRNEDEIFEFMEKNNFVIFHREADTR